HPREHPHRRARHPPRRPRRQDRHRLRCRSRLVLPEGHRARAPAVRRQRPPPRRRHRAHRGAPHALPPGRARRHPHRELQPRHAPAPRLLRRAPRRPPTLHRRRAHGRPRRPRPPRRQEPLPRARRPRQDRHHHHPHPRGCRGGRRQDRRREPWAPHRPGHHERPAPAGRSRRRQPRGHLSRPHRTPRGGRVTLVALRARAGARTLAARPLWLAGAMVLLAAISYGGYRLVKYGVEWLYAYPLITTIAPAVTQRSLEGFFLMLMAAVLFSVLIASIGTLYGSDDLELLLAHPTDAARVFGMKVLELFVNAAGLPLLFTLPVLAGVGVALDAHPLYYPVSVLAAAALYALPVTLGALLALVLVRLSPAGRVREVATAVSISAAAAALLGLRAL